MKVVLFCGGQGMRLREYSEQIPKPMVPIGYRPILWHLMRYYAHYGHKEFILCLGYRADAIKSYFINYDETLSNDFVMSGGGSEVTLLNRDIADWKITFGRWRAAMRHVSTGRRWPGLKRPNAASRCGSRGRAYPAAYFCSDWL